MSNEEISEDRLTKDEFSELIQHLAVEEILSIEYVVRQDWEKLFSRRGLSFTCNLCIVDTSSFKNLIDHINGKKHKLEMEKVKKLYHYDYTYPKIDEKKSFAFEVTDNENSSTSLANSMESDCNLRQENKEKCLYNKMSAIKNREFPCKNDKTDRNIEIEPKNQNTNNSLKILTNSNKERKIKKQNKCNEHIFTEKETIEQQKNHENSVRIRKEMQNSDVKNLYNEQQKHSNNIPPLIIPLCNETNKSYVNCKINSNVGDGVKKNVISEESGNSKEFIAERYSKVDDKHNNDFNLRTRQIVINPAAALAFKKTSLNLEKNSYLQEEPKYETNKIITPTANKYNLRDEAKSASYISPTRLRDVPEFSVKTYSSKSGDTDVRGILGVEYVVKILRHRNDSSPRFECGLCELVLDGLAMQRHLEGYNHRLKFCEKHFPTAVRHYRQYMQSVPEHEIFKVMTPVLEKLAKAIENHHGRSLPYECYEREFNLNRHEVLAKAFSCRHASEQYGPTFTHVIGSEEIDRYINGRQNYTPPTASHFAVFDIKPGESKERSEFMLHSNLRNADKKLLSLDHIRNRHFLRTASDYLPKDNDNSHKPSGVINDLYPQTKISDQTNREEVREHVDDKTYNLMVENFLKGISGKSNLRGYRKRSASPSSELNLKKRKSLSPLRDNDIWQAYRHMVDQELNKLEQKFKQYHNDPETHPSYNEEWQIFWKRRKDELISTGLDHRNYNFQPEWVKFIKVRMEEMYTEEVENIKIKCRERLCLPMTNSNLLDIKYHVQAVNVPQVVSVLRLMTALEDSLGSLGPKITKLLSKALQTEKTNPTLVNAIILTEENCSLIETAKEKFKGLFITGLLEGTKQKVLQQVINDTEDLLQYAHQNKQFFLDQKSTESTYRTQNCTSLPDKSLSEGQLPLAENLLPNIDKKELASKLAASLVAQGKTDFDPQNLQQLLTFYTLIEKKKRLSRSYISSKETNAVNKKKLSETLSDLIKLSSTASENSTGVDRHLSSGFNMIQQKNFPSTTNTTSNTSFNSALQNSGDNYLINSINPQFSENAHGRNSIKAPQCVRKRDYGSNYNNNYIPNQKQFTNNNAYSSGRYQNNNRIAQNWVLNSNMEINSNHDSIQRPNSYNQPLNWRKF